MSLEIRLFLGIFCLSVLEFKDCVAHNDRVPVLMWSNDGSLEFPPVFAGHTVKKDKFKEQFINKLLEDSNVQTIAVFMQDKLSLTEISTGGDVYSTTGGGGAFSHTKDLMTEFPSTFLSSVASPSVVFGDLETSFPGKSFTLQPPYNIADLQVGAAGKKLVVVQLPEQHGSRSGLTDYLHHIDSILNNVTYQLKSLPGRFAAFYTGRKNHKQSAYEQHSGRQLLDFKDGSSNSSVNGLVLSVDKLFLMHASNISIDYNSGFNHTALSVDPSSWNVTAGNDCPHGGNMTNTTDVPCTIFLKYAETVHLDDIQLNDLLLTMEFITSSSANGGYWYLKTFSMTYTNATTDQPVSNTTVIMNERFIDWTPFKFSYHCHENPPVWSVVSNASEYKEDIAITFKAFQVQVFYVNGGFGYYNDCVGFFTIGIWSAIIVCAVLIAILFYGVLMLLDIKTMDRLDDAKGKTITVNVSD